MRPRMARESFFNSLLTLSGLKKKLDFHCLERKDDSTIIGAVNDPSGKQGSHITMNSLYIAAGASGGFSN